jgi:hypothetical protein
VLTRAAGCAEALPGRALECHQQPPRSSTLSLPARWGRRQYTSSHQGRKAVPLEARASHPVERAATLAPGCTTVRALLPTKSVASARSVAASSTSTAPPAPAPNPSPAVCACTVRCSDQKVANREIS